MVGVQRAKPFGRRRLVKTDYVDSAIASAEFTEYTPPTPPDPPTPEVVSTPVISPNGGAFDTAQTVTLTCATYAATVYYTTDGKDPTTASAVYDKPFEIMDSCVVKAKGVCAGMVDSSVASASFTKNEPKPHEKPYVIAKDGNEIEYDTVRDALDHAVAGDIVIVPVLIELTGDLIVPDGVTLSMNGNVYTAPTNEGKLIVRKDGILTTKAGENIIVSPPVNSGEKEGAYACFTSIEVSGVFTNGGTLTLSDVKNTGDGRVEIVGAGEVTLNGEASLGKVKLFEGRTVTLGASFKAIETAATVIIGDGYELGRAVLTFKGEGQGKLAKFFKLGNAPDKSWYIDENGALSRKVDPVYKYLLLDKAVMGKGKKINAANLLPVNFKGGVTWHSDNEAVLKITGKGAKKSINPVAVGSAKLTATFADGTAETITVSVAAKKEAATVLTLKKKLKISVGMKETLNAKVKPATASDKTLKWFTTDAAIADVDQTGVVTAISQGTCKVYAITTAGVCKVVTVNVKKAK